MTMPFHPLLLDLPSTIETERLLLRTPQAGDGGAVHEALAESIVELRRFMGLLPWVAAEPTVQASELFCRQSQAQVLLRKDFPFLLIERASGRLVGLAGLHRPEWLVPKIEVGYWCRTGDTGRGLITEAVRAVTELAFRQLFMQRVELVADEANVRSRRVAERSGFLLEGIQRHAQRGPDGSLRNLCLYARLPEAGA